MITSRCTYLQKEKLCQINCNRVYFTIVLLNHLRNLCIVRGPIMNVARRYSVFVHFTSYGIIHYKNPVGSHTIITRCLNRHCVCGVFITIALWSHIQRFGSPANGDSNLHVSWGTLICLKNKLFQKLYNETKKLGLPHISATRFKKDGNCIGGLPFLSKLLN